MGSLIHIAEVAVLIFAAYVVGWLIGYVLHRVTARPAKVAVVAAGATAQAPTIGAQPDGALVRAPLVVPVTASTPPHLQAKVTQIEPATAVAVPDGMVLAEPRTIDVPKVPAAPVSALESLESLTTIIPLAPIELRPIVASAQPVQVRAEATEAVPTVAVTEVASSAADSPGEAAFAPPAEPEMMPAAEQVPVEVPPSVPPVEAEDAPAAVEPEVVLAVSEPVGLGSGPVAEPEPVPEPEPVLAPAERLAPVPNAPSAMPSSRPGVAWSGAIKGREASPFERVAEVATNTEPDGQGPASAPAGLDVSLLESLADELEVDEPALPVDQLDQLVAAAESSTQIPATELAEPLAAELPEPAAAAIIEPVAAGPLLPPEPEVPAGASPPRRSEFDEDAAMRAIEGGWSRRQTRAMSDAHELTDVSAAVSAAQLAVEQVLAANGIDAGDGTRAQSSFGKPRGLPQPRNNRRDNLKQINGLGPLDESTLNNLGIYHFEQIAGWDQKEVLWLENHAFARGRIGREDWQAQARSLMVDSEAARRIGG
jgi:predicted flap endonuclease-1-like 5' DNA nuclease